MGAQQGVSENSALNFSVTSEADVKVVERLQPDIPDCQTTLCVARSREKAEEESTEESGPVIFPEAPVGGVPSPIVDSQVLDSSSSRRQSTGALQLALTPAPSQTESTSPILTSTIETTL